MAKYIEREEAKEELVSWARCINDPKYLLTEDAMCVLDGMKAADVVEVKHGAWKCVGQVCVDGEYEDTFRCSKCSIPYFRKSRYCPNCGARMRGAEDG